MSDDERSFPILVDVSSIPMFKEESSAIVANIRG
jgi:hypothetical protein